MFSVAAFGFVLVGKTDEHKNCLGILCGVDRLFNESVLADLFLLFLIGYEAGRIREVNAHFLKRIVSAVKLNGIDKRRACALITRLLRHLTDNGDFSVLLKRKNVVLVFKKYHTL